MRRDKIETLVKPVRIKSLIYDYVTADSNDKYKMFKDVIGFLEVNANFDFVVVNTIVERHNEISIVVSGLDKKNAIEFIRNG